MTSLANASAAEIASPVTNAARLFPVRVWLFTVAALVFAMVLVGGATRLTGSGLSITEWQPILGVFPPLSEAAWQETFQKYQHIPEYELINRGMSLSAFKAIYWWEWTHRLLGRFIGFVFLLPFLYFLARGSIPRRSIVPIGALFVLGGAQGALGWFMVKSGLSDRVEVSQYRLAAHLALAVAIGGYALWLGLSTREASRPGSKAEQGTWLKSGAGLLACLVYLQIIAGAFVAGLKAGHASNTWPLMNGEIIPEGLNVYSPWYLNLFENPLTAQFTHRILAYVIAIFAAAFGALLWRSYPGMRAPIAAHLCAILLQIALGVLTIVLDVPLGMALAHQANAIIVFGLSIWTVRRANDDAYMAASA
ncbi:MAG: COX15/CtaA family protein [Rhodomicrobium sp.]